jgi:competence protein ComEA
VRVRLAALSGGRIIAAPESTHPEAPPLLVLPERQELVDETTSTDDAPPLVLGRSSLRPVVVAVAATALVAWIVVRVTVGGSPSTVEVVPGTPIPMASGVIAASPEVSSSTSLGAAPSGGVVVQVVGQVRRPGLVRLSPGARVADAVAAAGGLVRGGSSGGLNLARQVVDGEQIVVSPDAVAPPSAATGAPDSVVVDLNSATLSDLDALPGVGPVMAGRILDWRTAHGRFTTVDQLREVSGIGARTFERLKPHVRV